MRQMVRRLVETIPPGDELETAQRTDILAWIDSGAELWRRETPAVPPKHLVCYFVVIDPVREKLLLVDHIDAQKWLPAGGHVMPDEHPHATVIRESWRALYLDAHFLWRGPFFVTEARTGGRSSGHTDVSLWYAVRGSTLEPALYDPAEFHGVRWFSLKEILALPVAMLDPNLHRFVRKWQGRPRPTP